ncbi:UNVERIFIED_CONTAM: hypothetical protein K2H54_028485 [Gekko kuhli]
MKVAAALLMDIPLDMIEDEWRLEDETASETCHIDTYWNQFFEKTHPSGDPKYPLVTKVVKAALSSLHEEQKEKKEEKAEKLERFKKIDSEKDSIQEKEAKLKKLRQQNEKRMIA